MNTPLSSHRRVYELCLKLFLLVSGLQFLSYGPININYQKFELSGTWRAWLVLVFCHPALCWSGMTSNLPENSLRLQTVFLREVVDTLCHNWGDVGVVMVDNPGEGDAELLERSPVASLGLTAVEHFADGFQP